MRKEQCLLNSYLLIVDSKALFSCKVFLFFFFSFLQRAVKERFNRAYFNARYRLEVRRPTEARTCPPSRETCVSLRVILVYPQELRTFYYVETFRERKERIRFKRSPIDRLPTSNCQKSSSMIEIIVDKITALRKLLNE